MTSLEDIKKEAVDLVSFSTLCMFGLTMKCNVRTKSWCHRDFDKLTVCYILFVTIYE